LLCGKFLLHPYLFTGAVPQYDDFSYLTS
jgi:hypothetical protein